MKVTIARCFEYTGKDTPEVESFELTVENGPTDDLHEVADMYLELREKLNDGLKEGSE